jgi:hypothetical protein
MRIPLVLTALTVMAVPLAAQADPDKKVEGTPLPAGWSARLDRASASMASVKFVTMGSGLHFTLGPAVIVWREADAVAGAFHTEATFTQTKAPTHPEAFGMFVAGKDLNGEGQTYTYFLVRGTGDFLIKKRSGTQTTNVAEWTANEAVTKQDEAGKATYKLEIAVGQDGKASFMVNGKEVHSMAGAAGAMNGIVGLRVNHNLDVHVAGFGVHKM